MQYRQVGVCQECLFWDDKACECHESTPDTHGLWPPSRKEAWCGKWHPCEELQGREQRTDDNEKKLREVLVRLVGRDDPTELKTMEAELYGIQNPDKSELLLMHAIRVLLETANS